MFVRTKIVAAAAIVSAALPVLAGADPITLSSSRFAISDAHASDTTGQTGSSSSPEDSDAMHALADATLPASHAEGTADLVTNLVDPHHLSGEGMASAVASGPDSQAFADGLTGFNLLVTLSVAQVYDFNASFDGSGRGVTWLDSGSAVSAPNTSLFGDRNPFAPNISHSGVLQPGTYGFDILGDAQAVSSPFGPMFASVGFNFTLDFSDPGSPSPTPELASAVLLMTAIGALGWRRLLFAR
jgi:hypothetical protein